MWVNGKISTYCLGVGRHISVRGDTREIFQGLKGGGNIQRGWADKIRERRIGAANYCFIFKVLVLN